METKTPLTDAAALVQGYADDCWNKWVSADFARDLETKLKAAEQARKEAEERERKAVKVRDEAIVENNAQRARADQATREMSKLREAAQRVYAKYGADKDWTEWKDLKDALRNAWLAQERAAQQQGENHE